jgi:hypothetical protein
MFVLTGMYFISGNEDIGAGKTSSRQEGNDGNCRE